MFARFCCTLGAACSVKRLAARAAVLCRQPAGGPPPRHLHPPPGHLCPCQTHAIPTSLLPPPPADNPLVGRPDVICTPHLGASTREAQEEVAYEIAEAVISALKVRGWA